MVKRKPVVSGKTKVSKIPVTVLLGDPSLPDSVKMGGHFNPEDLKTVALLKEALSGLKDYEFSFQDNHAVMLDALKREPPAYVMNLCDEGYENDAFRELHVPAYLEMLNLPYTGAGPSCLGLCYDKGLVRSIAMDMGVHVPLETFVSADNVAGSIPATYPSLLKPVTGDSSIGITERAVVHTQEEAVDYLQWLRGEFPGRGILVQEYLTGPEYTVGLIGNPGFGYNVLPVLEVDYSGLPDTLPPILTHSSKWDPDSPYWTEIKYKEAVIPPEVQREMTNSSIQLFERLGCRDYARFDFRCDAKGTPKLLEANPNPGWCWDGKFNLMAEFAGYSYREMLGMMLSAFFRRCEEDESLKAASA